jgi:hypothetical protein
MKTKKLPYGTKGNRIRELLTIAPDKSDKEIARAVKCTTGYVKLIRQKEYESELKGLEAEGLIARVTMPLDSTLEVKGALHKITSGTGRVNPNRDDDELNDLLGARGSTYGSFMQSANIAIRLKSVMHNAIAHEDLHLMPDQMLALDMIAVKISRILTGNAGHRDSWLDIAGYAKLVADRLGGTSR